MALTAKLTRREALASVSSVCVAAALPAPPEAHGDTADRLIAEATREPRAMRDGSRPFSEADRQADRLPDNSIAGTVDTARRSREFLSRASRISSRHLPSAQRDALDTLVWDLGCDVAAEPFYYREFPLGYSFSQLVSLTLQFLASANADSIGNYLAKARQAPTYVDNIRLRLLGQLQRNLTVPRAEGERAVAQFRKESKEVANALAAAAAANGGAFASELTQIIAGPLAASFAALAETLERKYVPALAEQSRMARGDGAKAYFRILSNARLSDQLDIASVHQMATDALADIDADLARMRRSLGGPSNADAFNKSMAGNPRWFVRDAADLTARFDSAVARVTPLAAHYFHRLPATPFRVAPLPDFLSDRLLNGYFSGPTKADPRGTYFFNTSHLDVANWAWIKPLVSHELMPGHHLQGAMLFERTDLSAYQRGTFVGAVAEGWGEYARRLMEEAGYYEDDPWGLYASRLLDRRFALRTVVESGITHSNWTWQKAAEQLATDPLTRPETTHQIALAAASFRSTGLLYWWGLQRFFKLREQAKSAARAAFDIRDFHARVMTGEVPPFSILENRVLG